MKFSKLALAAAAAGSMAIAPVAANAQESSEMGGGSDIVRGAIVAAIAGIGMVILLATDDDEDMPVSA